MASDADDNAHQVPDDNELGPIITALKLGTSMTRFRAKNKVEPKTFQLNLEEFKISWFRAGTGREEGKIYIEEIKEVRSGVISRDFSHFLKKIENPHCCIVIVYGNNFRLKTLSCMAQNVNERNYWVKGLIYLQYRNQFVPPLALTHRWLCREWSALPKNSQHRMSMREYKVFLQRANIKLPNSKVKDTYQSVLQSGNSGIDANGFCRAYDNLLYQSAIAERFALYFHRVEEGMVMFLQDFQNFLSNEQEDYKAAHDLRYVKDIMLQCIPDESIFQGADPYFDMKQFLNYLFSPVNSIFNEDHNEIYQDMTKPLNYYWIASSHNTYLTGDQVQSESSVENYIRCLRMGCRCVELDCWDGDAGEPIIYHGLTLTTRIKFADVVRVIAKNAFAASEYPLILSIENHCTIPQQIVMANCFKKYLKGYLVTQFIDSNETQLPSPEALKNKIILKNKKINRSGTEIITNNKDALIDDNLLSNALKVGHVQMEDEERKWNKHLFVLTTQYIYYSYEQEGEEEDDDDDGDGEQNPGNEDDLHFSEKWFHRNISRQEAESLLRTYQKGDGSFLVRPSNMFVGDFSLSFWRQGRVQHCRIKLRQSPEGATKYFLVGPKSFDNLYSLINYYQQNPLKSDKFEMRLTEPVPQPNAHLGKDWYHENLTRQQAEDMLKRMRKDGYFLVRRRATGIDGDADAYAISFRTGGSIKHCVIKKEGRLYMIGSAPFESLVDLVTHYEKYTLYRKTKLQYPCHQKVVQEFGVTTDHRDFLKADLNPEADEGEDSGCIYAPPNLTTPRPACMARYDYKGQQDDELTFYKGAMIVNIVKYDGGWWKGDYNGQIQKWFPVNFTEETVLKTRPEPAETKVENPLASMQKGAINLSGCQPQIQPSTAQRQYIFSLNTRDGTYNCSVDDNKDMIKWLELIQEASTEAENAVSRINALVGQKKIAMELSDLVIYCVTVPFSEERFDCGEYFEMSSFHELKAEKYISKRTYDLRLQQRQLSRIYPKGTRIDSSNYDPVPYWNFGCQMCALNYQTDDRSMQVERGTFLDNGRCGYVLQPEFMRDPDFNPFDKSTLKGVEPLNINLTIIAARHLPKNGRRLTTPFVVIEIVGLSYDQQSFTTKPKNENGLCPTWNETFNFDVICPPLAKIRFCVNDEDMFGEPNFVAQACFPLTSLRPGYRSVPLKNSFSEDIPLASLLVEINMQNAQDDEEYATIAELRDKMQNLMDKQDVNPQSEEMETQTQLMHFQDQLSRLTRERETRHQQMEADKTKKLPR